MKKREYVPSKRIKNMWKKSGKMDPLKKFAAALDDRVAADWLKNKKRQL